MTTGKHSHSISNSGSYVLKVILTDSDPVVWRGLELPGSSNLGILHGLKQKSPSQEYLSDILKKRNGVDKGFLSSEY